MTIDVERIRDIALVRGVKLSHICTQLGLTRVYFNDLAKKDKPVPDDRLAAIAEMLYTTPEYLRGETDDPETKKDPSTEPGSIRDDQLKEIMRLWESLPDDKRPEAERYLRYLIASADER